MGNKQKAYVKTKSQFVMTLSPSDFDGTLKDLKTRINELIETHGENAYLDFDATHCDPYSSPYPMYLLNEVVPLSEEELAAEEAARVAAEVAAKDARFKLFEKLQAEFVNKA